MFSLSMAIWAYANFFSTTSLAAEPLRALLITGGCCHDYTAQTKTLTEGISARANVAWTIIHEGDSEGKNHKFSIYEKPDWAAGTSRKPISPACPRSSFIVPFTATVTPPPTNGASCWASVPIATRNAGPSRSSTFAPIIR